MTPFYFGRADSQLFGVYTPPPASVAREASVLVCAPLGLEYLRTYYALRLLAAQLASMGFHVLRFDYHGTGDSAGEIGAGQFERWLDDISLAMQELAELSGSDEPILVGLRMGATLALETAAQRRQKLKAAVLWDPVVSGSEYLAALSKMHAEMLAHRSVSAPASEDLLGMVYPADLRAAIENLDMARLIKSAEARGAALVVSEDRPEYRALFSEIQSGWPASVYRPMADPVDWNSLKAAYDARMTGPIVRAVAEAAESVA